MVSLSRLINHNGILKNGKFIRIAEHIRNSQFHLNATKACSVVVCPDPPSYITRLAFPRDYETVVNFLCCNYFRDEPSIVNIGLCGEPPTASMLNLALMKVKEGMTIIAVNAQRCVIGAAVNVGLCPWDPKYMIQYAKCCEEEGPTRDLIEFFAYVSRKPDIWNRYCVLKVFECNILAVDPEYRRIGVARKLVEESWYLARDCNYRLFRIDCTSRYAANIARGFRWDKVCTIPYCRYVKNCEMVFKHIQEPHTEVEVYVDTVDYYKSYTLPYHSRKCK